MRTPIRILALAGVVAVLAFAAVALRGTFGRPARTGPGSVVPPASAGGDENVVERALRLAKIDPGKKKQWVDDIPDLPLGSLGPGPRETFLRIANVRPCGCGCGFTLAGCRRFDSECETSGPRARALFDSVRAGWISNADGYPERPARQ